MDEKIWVYDKAINQFGWEAGYVFCYLNDRLEKQPNSMVPIMVKEIANYVGFNFQKTNRILNELVKKEVLLKNYDRSIPSLKWSIDWERLNAVVGALKGTQGFYADQNITKKYGITFSGFISKIENISMSGKEWATFLRIGDKKFWHFIKEYKELGILKVYRQPHQNNTYHLNNQKLEIYLRESNDTNP